MAKCTGHTILDTLESNGNNVIELEMGKENENTNVYTGNCVCKLEIESWKSQNEFKVRMC